MVDHELIKRVVIDPEIMLGKPVIKGTCLPAALIVEKIAYVAAFPDILKQYPFLEEDDIHAALIYAASIMSGEEVFAV
jgi:uncharacterized protein (DUF433 family)